MGRRRFTEKDVLRTLIHQGVEIRDFRTGELITLENVGQVEREHLVELGLVTADERPKYDQPEYCRYSLKASHDIITNGTKATTAGSSKNRIAKATQPKRIAKFVVNKLPPGERPQRAHKHRIPGRVNAWGPRGSRPMNRNRRA